MILHFADAHLGDYCGLIPQFRSLLYDIKFKHPRHHLGL